MFTGCDCSEAALVPLVSLYFTLSLLIFHYLTPVLLCLWTRSHICLLNFSACHLYSPPPFLTPPHLPHFSASSSVSPHVPFSPFFCRPCFLSLPFSSSVLILAYLFLLVTFFFWITWQKQSLVSAWRTRSRRSSRPRYAESPRGLSVCLSACLSFTCTYKIKGSVKSRSPLASHSAVPLWRQVIPQKSHENSPILSYPSSTLITNCSHHHDSQIRRPYEKKEPFYNSSPMCV